MLHLAQVQKKGFLGKTELRLLAFERSENTWVVLSGEDVVTTGDINLNEGSLVLLDLTPHKQVQSIRDATKWVLETLQRYVGPGAMTNLEEEYRKVEDWRQSLTMQSQEYSRRQMELEARREQLQALEDNLSRREKELEANWHRLRSEMDRLNKAR